MPPEREVRHICARDRNGPCLPQPRNNGSVCRSDLVLESRHTPCRRRAGYVDILLDRERHTRDRSEWCAGGERLVDGSGGSTGLIRQYHGHRVDDRVDLLDAREVRLDHLSRSSLTRANHACQFDRTLRAQLVHPFLPDFWKLTPRVSENCSCLLVILANAD